MAWRVEGGKSNLKRGSSTTSELFNTELKVFRSLVSGALRGLRLLHVVLEEHQATELLQERLDSVVTVPSGQHWNSPGVHLQFAK